MKFGGMRVEEVRGRGEIYEGEEWEKNEGEEGVTLSLSSQPQLHMFFSLYDFVRMMYCILEI